MDATQASMRALLNKALELFDDWMVLDKHGGLLLASFAGAIASVDEVNRGIESLYLAPPVVESYETNRSAVSVDNAISDLQDLAISCTVYCCYLCLFKGIYFETNDKEIRVQWNLPVDEVIAASMRLQTANLSLISQMEISPSDELTVSCSDMSMFVDHVAAMMLNEYAVKTAIIQDLKLETSQAVLSTYSTTWNARPHLDEISIEMLKERLAVHDQEMKERKG